MNIKDILLTIGTGLLSSTPLGLAALPVINALLPKDKQLPATATANQAKDVIKHLDPGQAYKIEMAEIDLLVEEEKGRTERYKAMCSSDGQTTRALLVNKAMNTLILLSLIFVSAIAYVYMTEGAQVAFSYELSLAFITVTGTFAYVVRAYFGDLRTETTSRHQTIDEKPRTEGFLTALIKRVK